MQMTHSKKGRGYGGGRGGGIRAVDRLQATVYRLNMNSPSGHTVYEQDITRAKPSYQSYKNSGWVYFLFPFFFEDNTIIYQIWLLILILVLILLDIL